MARVIADRTQETSTTTGTGTLDLDGAKAGFQGFVAAVGDGAEVYYTIVQQDPDTNDEWETGIGTVTDAATDTLSRDTVIASSNSGSLVTFSAGTKDVFISVPHTGGPLVIDKATPSGVASVDFALPSAYSQFEIYGSLLPASDGASLWIRFSNDGGSTFRSGASDYEWLEVRWNNVGGGEARSNSTGDSKIVQSTNTGNAAGEQSSHRFTIHSANSSSVRTSIVGQYNRRSSAGEWHSGVPTSEVLTEEVNDAIRILFSTGNIADGSLTLVGIP